MKKKFLRTITLVSLVTWFLAACTPASNPIVVSTPPPTSTPQVIQSQTDSYQAQVQSVAIQITNTTPAQINALVRGDLTESCATLGESQVQYDSNTIRITVYVVSPSNIGCVQTTTPFETTIPLNTTTLPAGTYTVIANGVSAVFTLPIDVATPTSIPSPTSTVAPTDMACVDAAKFVSDVTIPDNTVVASNIAFTKTWRLKNTGTCSWDNNYLVAYISGATMSQQPGYFIVPQGQTVAPGQTVNISVGMTSPVENGNYKSFWGLKNADGQVMPVQGGANGNSFYVEIKVNDGSTPFGKVTAASIDIELEQGSGAACTADSTYFVGASITADGPATASYEIGSTAGQIPAGYFQDYGLSVTGTVVFDQAETKTINLHFVGPYPYPADITVNLRVNGGEWYNTELFCPQ